MTHILHIDSSARTTGSLTREKSADIVARLVAENPGATVTRRDLASGQPFLTETWVGANFTPANDRTEAQAQELSHSDQMIAELDAADVIVIGMPVYNFSAPASLKAWLDQVARVGRTFRYSEAGPEGLLKGKRAIVAYASGGVPFGAPIEFASPYIKHMLGFMGITDVTFEFPEAPAQAA